LAEGEVAVKKLDPTPLAVVVVRAQTGAPGGPVAESWTRGNRTWQMLHCVIVSQHWRQKVCPQLVVTGQRRMSQQRGHNSGS